MFKRELISKQRRKFMIKINDTWSYEVDSNNNHLPYRMKTVAPKDKEEYDTLKHTGAYLGDLPSLLRYMVKVDLQESTPTIKNVEDYIDKYEEISVKLLKDFNNQKGE